MAPWVLLVMIWISNPYHDKPIVPPAPGFSGYAAQQLVVIPAGSQATCTAIANRLRWAKNQCFDFDYPGGVGDGCGGMPSIPGGPVDVRAGEFWIVGCYSTMS